MWKVVLPLFLVPVLVLAGVSPIKEGTAPVQIEGEFGLADGPAWDGGALTVADPKAEAAPRYMAAKKVWGNGPKGKKFSASFFNHGYLYYSDHGNGAILRKNREGELAVVHQEDVEADKTRRPNDLVVDRAGGVFFTLTKPGQVVYVSPEGESKVVADDAAMANGLILSPDESILYVAEFLNKTILAYDVGEEGALSGRREFAKIEDGDPESRGADGMTIDRAGNVYCAGPDGVWIWAPDGEFLDKIVVGEKPINCTFGGTDLRDLYITGFGGLHVQRMRISGVSPQMATFPNPHNKNRLYAAVPEGVTSELDLTYAQYGTRKMLGDVFMPAGDGPHPAVVVLHGGGWHSGDKMKFRALSLELAKRGYVTMAVAYRLSEEAKFPANIHDCHAAVRYLRANAERFGADPERIGVVGGSAGGHLAGLLAVSAEVESLHGDGGNAGVSSAVQCAVVMSAPMQIATGSVAERSMIPDNPKPNGPWLFGGTIEEVPEVYAAADAYQKIDENTPPILFQYGGTEDATKTDASTAKLKELGIPTRTLSHYEGGKHGCWNMHPWFLPMVDDIEDWLKECF